MNFLHSHHKIIKRFYRLSGSCNVPRTFCSSNELNCSEEESKQDLAKPISSKHTNFARYRHMKGRLQPANRVLSLLHETSPEENIDEILQQTGVTEFMDATRPPETPMQSDNHSSVHSVEERIDSKRQKVFYNSNSTHSPGYCAGELVHIKIPKQSRRGNQNSHHWIFKLEDNGAKSVNTKVKHSDLIGMSDVYYRHNRFEIPFKRPSILEYLDTFLNVPDSKVTASVLSKLGISTGDFVMEDVKGYGVSSLLLSLAVGKAGHVYSFQNQPGANTLSVFDRWRNSYNLINGREPWPNNMAVHFDAATRPHNQGLHKNYGPYDHVFTELSDVDEGIGKLVSSLKFGHCICVSAESPMQILKFKERVEEDDSASLVLENMWEDKNRQWEYIHMRNKISEDWEHPRIDMWPTQVTGRTVFAAKFRKVVLEDMLPEEGSLHTSSSPFVQSETVIVSPLENRKPFPQRDRSYLMKLVHGKELHLFDGIIYHDDIIGSPPGSLIQTHKGRKYYKVRPNLMEFLAYTKRTQLAELSSNYAQKYCLAVLLSEIREGDKVLTYTQDKGVAALIYAQAVGSSGRVDQLWSSPGKTELQSRWEENSSALGKENKSSCIKTVFLPEETEHLPDDVFENDTMYDSICLSDKTAHILLSCAEKLKYGKYTIIICMRFETVKKVSDMIKTLPLWLDMLYDDTEAPWLAVKEKLTRVQYKNGRVPETYLQPTPTKNSTVFIMKLRKI